MISFVFCNTQILQSAFFILIFFQKKFIVIIINYQKVSKYGNFI